MAMGSAISSFTLDLDQLGGVPLMVEKRAGAGSR
jgi:hypothetical protein